MKSKFRHTLETELWSEKKVERRPIEKESEQRGPKSGSRGSMDVTLPLDQVSVPGHQGPTTED